MARARGMAMASAPRGGGGSLASPLVPGACPRCASFPLLAAVSPTCQLRPPFPPFTASSSRFPAWKMQAFLVAFFLLHSAPSSWVQCVAAPDNCSVQLSTFSGPTTNLSFQGIGNVSFQVLDLSCKCVQSHPGFFTNVSCLVHLSLQGNPLSSVLASAFNSSLLQLSVDCRYDVVRSILGNCTCSHSANCTSPSGKCFMQEGKVFDAFDFYKQQCLSLDTWLSATIAGSVLAVLLVGGLGVVFFVCRRKRQAATSQSKRESTSSIAHGQARYISREAKPAVEQGSCQARDYENVFIGHAQPLAAGQYECLDRKAPQYRVPQLVAEEYYMESDACSGDQPIYANTQQAYGGESSSFPPHDAEDVYIIPDK
uniref:Uncharacterized protein n=2 Tax=Pelusios castaneus TaxID=367368 RepID=A0A8C8SEP5_9SAUR